MRTELTRRCWPPLPLIEPDALPDVVPPVVLPEVEPDVEPLRDTVPVTSIWCPT